MQANPVHLHAVPSIPPTHLLLSLPTVIVIMALYPTTCTAFIALATVDTLNERNGGKRKKPKKNENKRRTKGTSKNEGKLKNGKDNSAAGKRSTSTAEPSIENGMGNELRTRRADAARQRSPKSSTPPRIYTLPYPYSPRASTFARTTPTQNEHLWETNANTTGNERQLKINAFAQTNAGALARGCGTRLRVREYGRMGSTRDRAIEKQNGNDDDNDNGAYRE
ncbi:hypothetical protein CCMSSC00406_0010029 [Pleurotus cornucopiae]|uniref:Uncharacterized protein n=1 Tax=Pleurotus cornucopiae TaxID=5321 RepID=A0ACB7IK25_PLECO|nr:hypothetical protein CCMSSC00406_0010029 [Pleurotus cornucopiae]